MSGVSVLQMLENALQHCVSSNAQAAFAAKV